MAYETTPVSVSNQQALWKKAKQEFVGFTTTSGDYLTLKLNTSSHNVYKVLPASDADFKAYMGIT